MTLKNLGISSPTSRMKKCYISKQEEMKLLKHEISGEDMHALIKAVNIINGIIDKVVAYE